MVQVQKEKVHRLGVPRAKGRDSRVLCRKQTNERTQGKTIGEQDTCKTVEEGVERYKSMRIRKCAVKLCLLVTSEATPIKCHQHECPARS